MGQEIDLLANYPKPKRNLDQRAGERTAEHQRIAREFGKDFFDGDRSVGYGGYGYHARFWEGVIPDFQSRYGLSAESSVLDVGCGKGFMLYDMARLIPGITVAGIDISEYAIENCKEEMRPYLQVADAKALPFEDDSFDLVVSITTVHNLVTEECVTALKEMNRVSRAHAFLTVDAYNNEEEKARMDAWNLTALTYMSTGEWRDFFADAGYTGDYYWFIP